MGGTPEANYTSFRDVIKYYIPYNSFVENTAYYMSEKSWAKLDDAQKAAVESTFGKAALASFETSQSIDEELMGKLSEAGVTVIALSDEERGAIADHVRATTWPKLEEVFGKELLDALNADAE